MPRRSKKTTNKRVRSRRVRNINNMMGMSVKIPFNYILQHSYSSATTVSTPFKPSFDPVLSSIASNFEFYRFTTLQIKALPASQIFDFTYYPNTESNPYSDSFTTLAVSSLNRVVSAAQTAPVYLNVPSRLLYQTPEDWWTVSSLSALAQQGRFVSATPSSFTGILYFQVTGIIEFKAISMSSSDLVSVSVTPQVTMSSVDHPPASCSCRSH